MDKLNPVYTDPTKMLPEIDLVAKQTNEFITKASETQDAFIFQTIGPFCERIAGFEISKKELIDAITLLRTMKQCSEIYGVSLYTTNVDSATYISNQCAQAYNRGYEDGVKEMKTRYLDSIKSMLEEE